MSGTFSDLYLSIRGNRQMCLIGMSGDVWGCLGMYGCLGCLGMSGDVWGCLGMSGDVWDGQICIADAADGNRGENLGDRHSINEQEGRI